MLFENEHESSFPLSRVGQVLFYVTALAILQDFREEKKQLKITASWLFLILFLRNLSWVILV